MNDETWPHNFMLPNKYDAIFRIFNFHKPKMTTYGNVPLKQFTLSLFAILFTREMGLSMSWNAQEN